MKAAQYVSYGDSSVLQLAQIDKPELQENEILIKITATTINPMDIKIRSGYLQKAMPLPMPFVPGLDVVGIVEAIGSKVTRLKIGDEVYATTFGGTYAEYVALDQEKAALKPTNVSANEAVALAVPLVTSYTFLVQNGQLQSGQRVLIHGASGGVGNIMVQVAKALGAHVTGTASGAGIELVKAFGADEVIDYKTQDFTKIIKDVDLVVDLVGGETLAKSYEVVKKGGKLLSAVMPPSAELAEKFGITAQFLSSEPSYKKLEFCTQLVEQGKIRAQIAKIMKLEQAAEAQDLVSNGGLNGKVILEIN